MSSSDVDDDNRSVVLSLTMESIEVVAAGEAFIFIAMKRKPGGLLDLVCKSGEKRNMTRDFCDRTRSENLADLVLRLWMEHLGNERIKLGDSTGGRAGQGLS